MKEIHQIYIDFNVLADDLNVLMDEYLNISETHLPDIYMNLNCTNKGCNI